jgi:hypothetical protein
MKVGWGEEGNGVGWGWVGWARERMGNTERKRERRKAEGRE